MKKFLTLALAVGMMYNVASAQSTQMSKTTAPGAATGAGAQVTSSINTMVTANKISPATGVFTAMFPASMGSELALQVNKNNSISGTVNALLGKLQVALKAKDSGASKRIARALRVLANFDAKLDANDTYTKAVLNFFNGDIGGKFDANSQAKVLTFLADLESNSEVIEKSTLEMNYSIRKGFEKFNGSEAKAMQFAANLSSLCKSGSSAANPASH